MDLDELQRPLTEVEVAELMHAASKVLTVNGMMVLRRLAFQHDVLKKKEQPDETTTDQRQGGGPPR